MPADTITILKSAGPLLTKVFDGDQVIPYDSAKTFSVETLPVGDLKQLSSLLHMLEAKGRRCVIRGTFIGDAAAQAIAPPEKPGMYQRLNQLYEELPHHWAMLDIDHYNCVMYDPATEPEEAIREFIQDKLPAEFHEASFHWQLSSSAGRTPGLLRCHIWVWLSTSYTGPQLKSWVRANELPIDVAPLRKAQIHYVANPVFKNGAIDPVAQRSGLYRGTSDSVDLVIPETLLASTDAPEHDTGDLDLIDPTQKAGSIGAFCRAYPISRVINELLAEEFIFAVGSDRRVTWLQSGGGAPEGCFITDDDWYLGNTHNTDPFDGRLANAWDLVRQYRFGELDAGITADERALYQVNELPSQRAMVAWVEGLPEIQTTTNAISVTTRAAFSDAILTATDEQALRNDVLPKIRECATLEKVDREHLAKLLQGKWRVLLGTTMAVADARDLVARARPERETDRDAPDWMKPWVFSYAKDQFFNLETRATTSITGFNMLHDRYMHPFTDEDGYKPTASNYCKDEWNIDTVAGVSYLPGGGQLFMLEGQQWANTYSSADVPDIPPVLTDSEEAAVKIVQDHMARLFPDERERSIFTSWLAYVARVRGGKVRWSPFIYGAPGVGKTFFLNLMGMVMGSTNVAPLDASVICNGNGFTGWSTGRALRCIEEVKMKGHNAHEVTNALKTFHTNDTIDVHCKNKDNFPAPNKTNYLLLSNYPDGLPLEEGDRRYYILHCSMTAEAATALCGSGYFKALFGAVETYPGAMLKWLTEYQLHPEFDPNGQAPMTAAKAMTIELAKSDLVMAAQDLLDNGAEGVTKNVIASSCFRQALEIQTGKEVFTTTVNRLIANLGFKPIEKPVKWKRKTYQVWVSTNPLPEGEEWTNENIRNELDAAGFGDEFLK